MGYREKIAGKIIKLCKVAADDGQTGGGTQVTTTPATSDVQANKKKKPPVMSLDASGRLQAVPKGTPWYDQPLPQQQGPGLLSSPAFDARTYADPIAEGISSGFRGFHRNFGRYANIFFWDKYRWWSRGPDDDEYEHALTDHIVTLGGLLGLAGLGTSLMLYGRERKNIREYNRRLNEAKIRYESFLAGNFSPDYVNKMFSATQGVLARGLFSSSLVSLRTINLRDLDPLAYRNQDGKVVLPSLKPALQLLTLEMMEEKHSKTFETNPDAQNRFKQAVDNIRNGVLASNFEVLKDLENQRIKRNFDGMMKKVNEEAANNRRVGFTFIALATEKVRQRVTKPDGSSEVATVNRPSFVRVTYTGRGQQTIVRRLNEGEANGILDYFNSRYERAQEALNILERYITNRDAKTIIGGLRADLTQSRDEVVKSGEGENIAKLADIVLRTSERTQKMAMELRRFALPELQKSTVNEGLHALNRALWDLSSPIVDHRGARILVLDRNVAESLNLRAYPAIRSSSLDVAGLEGTRRMREFARVQVRTGGRSPIRIGRGR
jgi:hypothetical protein